MDKETIENNKLIAEFMGYKLVPCNNGMAWQRPTLSCIHDDLRLHGRLWREKDSYYKFSSSWDWLMPVVEKIEGLGYEVVISRIACSVNRILDRDNPISSMVCGNISKKREITYDAIIQFIKWYNKNQTPC